MNLIWTLSVLELSPHENQVRCGLRPNVANYNLDIQNKGPGFTVHKNVSSWYFPIEFNMFFNENNSCQVTKDYYDSYIEPLYAFKICKLK